MLCREILTKIASNLISGPDPMSNLRNNLYLYIASPEITIGDIAKAANLHESTLNSILYGKSKSCNTKTAIALAKALCISVDELLGAGTIPRETQEAINICRNLPDQAKCHVDWFIHHQNNICNVEEKGAHIISVMHPEITEKGNLKVSEEYTSVDISREDPEIRRKVFMGLQLNVDAYMPKYSPYDILLIANDRKPQGKEDSVIVLDGNIFVARRQEESRTVQYYSIRDGRLRVQESECEEVWGYIAGVVLGLGFIAEGRS